MHTLLNTMIVTLLVCGVVSLILQSVFYFRLRQRHADVWQSLGRPDILGQGVSIRALIRFLWRREYRDFSDVQSVRLAGLYRVCLAIFMALFISCVIVFVLSLWR